MRIICLYAWHDLHCSYRSNLLSGGTLKSFFKNQRIKSDLLEKQDELLTSLNVALKSFEEEMKLQGLWENVTIVQASEFGRTITSNGKFNQKKLANCLPCLFMRVF